MAAPIAYVIAGNNGARGNGGLKELGLCLDRGQQRRLQSTGGGRNACGVKVAMATVGGRVEKARLVRCRLYIIDQVRSLSPSRSPSLSPPPPLSLSLLHGTVAARCLQADVLARGMKQMGRLWEGLAPTAGL